jgi:LemA protein
MSTSAWIVIGIAVVVLLYLVKLYNDLVRRRNMAREGWSGIDVQLRRRADLVPNLVQTVQGYAAHEKQIFEDIAATRASSISATTVADKAQAGTALSGALGRLFAIAEAYPALKADANFQSLQNELSEIEDQLQMARRYYNGTARELNILVESFPGVLVAGPFGFKPQAYFELGDAQAGVAPSIKF